MNEINVSVIIPIYNMEKYVRDCLDSIINQSLEKIEIICVDDGSTDQTRIILEDYALRFSNIKLIYQKHQYSGIARNNGMRHAQGEYVAFMDADDYYEDERVIEDLYNAAKENDVNICCGGIAHFDNEGKPSQLYKTEKIEISRIRYYNELEKTGSHVGAIFNKRFLEDNAIVFGITKNNQDDIFIVKAYACAERFYEIGRVVYHRRIVDKNYIDFYGIANSWLNIVEYLIPLREKYRKLYLYALFKLSLHLDYMYVTGAAQRLSLIEQFSRQDPQIIAEAEEKYNITFQILISPLEIEQRIKLVNEAYRLFMEGLNDVQRLMIYGAGILGRLIASHLLRRGYGNLSAFLRSSGETYIDKLTNLPVYAIDNLQEYDKETVIIIAVWPKDYVDVLSRLNKYGFRNYKIVKYNEFVAATYALWK